MRSRQTLMPTPLEEGASSIVEEVRFRIEGYGETLNQFLLADFAERYLEVQPDDAEFDTSQLDLWRAVVRELRRQAAIAVDAPMSRQWVG